MLGGRAEARIVNGGEKMIVGIDIGSTITKAVLLHSDTILSKIKTRTVESVVSATGVLGKIIEETGISLHDIEKIILTGVGSLQIQKNIFNLPTKKVDEITAIGYGGLYLSQKESMIITNIGTGTVIIEATKEKITHLGGSGVGGGTILGLSKQMLHVTDFNYIVEMAKKGDISKVDLEIQDVIGSSISFLNPESTASNFGKVLDTSKEEDIAIGIINLVYQVVGVLSVFAAKMKGCKEVTITGNGSTNEPGKEVLHEVASLYGMEFFFPNNAEYTTALGAAIYSKSCT
jgi:type II pantothenate kinase